ncbi:hypothetical protein [Clostridium beijerinckii]|uniref:hypothetical protein n=1 Tax=Clostridium beijerinckii TaxID=1520 RepID=UPI001F20792A|nr:hypothetical protein [Clostridium beijerinckii]
MFKLQMEILLKIIIFPFTTLEFYKKDYIKELSEADNYKKYCDIYKKKFRNVLYSSLNREYSLHTLDYVDMIIQKYYNHLHIQKYSIRSNKNNISENIYLDIISKFAKSFICHRNGSIALKYWESENDDSFIGPYKGINKIALWNSLNRMMCTDIIVITYLLDNKMNDEKYLNGYYSNIMMEDIQLEKILSRGVAETHFHKNAGINFTISWVHLMNLSTVAESDYKEIYLQNDIYDKEKIQCTVGAIAIIRLLLVKFLYTKNNNFYKYINDDKSDSNYTIEIIPEIVEKVCKGELFDNIFEIYKLKDIFEQLEFNLDVCTDEGNDDYVSGVFPYLKSLNTTGENLFLFKSLKYIREKRDCFFTKVFFQYIRIKNLVFQAKVQGDSIKGLKNFQPYYSRSTKLMGYKLKEYWLLLMNCQMQNKNLKKIEFRFGFNDKKNLKRIVISFLEAYDEFLNRYKVESSNKGYKKVVEKLPQMGLIFHMIKTLDEQGYNKCWQNAYNLEDPKDIEKELYYNAHQKVYMKQMETFNELRRKIDGLDKFLIGIDAASIEDNTEPWVFSPVYQQARNSGDSCLLYESTEHMQTLGFTFHVGEDFRYILTGLRHIDEVLEHFAYHAGDRIGHGIALGVDTKYWCEQNQVIMLPRGEYLDDLLWLWGVYKDKSNIESLDIGYLERKIMQVAEDVFECIDGLTVYMLWKAYQSKFETFKPDERFNYYREQGKSVPCDNRFECIHASTKNSKIFCGYLPRAYKELGQHWSLEALKYIQHCRCYSEKLLEPIQIEVDSCNEKLFKYLQNFLLDKVNNMGIIIETNPTSNLTIGEMEDLFHHYIFNLNNIDLKDEHHRAIISINSDDPSVFNTNVSNEIAYIFYALQKNGYSREESLYWIDKIRNYGMQSSFLQDDDITYDDLKHRIEHVLEQLKQ